MVYREGCYSERCLREVVMGVGVIKKFFQTYFKIGGG